MAHKVNYRPQTKLRKRYVFTPVCDSVHGGGSLQVQARDGSAREGCPGTGPRGVSRPRLGVSRSRAGCIPVCTEVDTPPPPQQMATAADGTHPTGMHSCMKVIFQKMAREWTVYPLHLHRAK